jgi:hypothetical protein
MDEIETPSEEILELIDLMVLNRRHEDILFGFPSRGSRVRIPSPAPVNTRVSVRGATSTKISLKVRRTSLIGSRLLLFFFEFIDCIIESTQKSLGKG